MGNACGSYWKARVGGQPEVDAVAPDAMERKDKRGKGEPQKTKGHPHPTLVQLSNPGKKMKEEQGERRKRERQEEERKKLVAE